jgi:hypothetical protein
VPCDVDKRIDASRHTNIQAQARPCFFLREDERGLQVRTQKIGTRPDAGLEPDVRPLVVPFFYIAHGRVMEFGSSRGLTTSGALVLSSVLGV